MKVVLLNKNPAVSRLIGLSVDKLGYDFKEISSKDDISGKIDILVADSEIEGFDSDLTLFADHTVFLVPKSLEKRPTGGEILEKPFLPTKFIEIIESFSNDSFADISSKNTEELKFDDFKDVMDDIEMSDSIGNDLETNNQDESLEDISQDVKDENNSDELNGENFDSMQDDKDSKENIDDLFENDDLIEVNDEKESKNTDEPQENLQEENLDINTQDTDEIDEISSIIDEIDNMDDDTDNNGDVLEIEEKENTLEKNQEGNKEDVINSEQNLIDNQDDILKDEHLKQEDLQELLDENDLSLENSENILSNDAINTDENINENLPQEDSDLKENLQNDDEILDEITEQVSEDKQEVEENEELEIEKKADDKQISNANIQNIDDITERVMKAALNEEILQDTENTVNSALNVHDEIDIKDDCIKQTIANKISEEINSTLSQSSIKEALKNMKININITFEDK